MDPLSLAASVAGLLTISTQITVSIKDFITAHQIADTVHLEIEHFNRVLRSITPFLLSPHSSQVTTTRTSMINLNELVITLTGCVCTFQELERKVKQLGKKGIPIPLRARVRWGLARSTIDGLVRQLQYHKSTLAIMLTILTCVSHDQALQAMHELKATVAQLVEIIKNQKNTGPETVSGRQPENRTIASSIRSFATARTSLSTALSSGIIRRPSQPQFAFPSSASEVIISTGLGTVTLAETSDILASQLPLLVQELNSPTPYQLTDLDKIRCAAFLHAASQGDNLAVSSWLERGMSIETSSEDSHTALLTAARFGHTATVELLLNKGAELEGNPNSGSTPFLEAVEGGHLRTVQLLISRGINIDAKDNEGNTGLHLAIIADQIELVQVLLSAGANRETEQGSPQCTPLVLAIYHKNIRCVQLLLGAGVTINRSHGGFWLPIHYATRGDVLILKLLIENGADVDALVNPEDPDIAGWSSLHIAAHTGNRDTATVLLDAGADIEAKEKHQMTAVHVAARAGTLPIIEMLSRRGAKINEITSSNQTAIHLAAEAGQTTVVAALLDLGVKLDAQDMYKQTALHEAASKENLETVKFLLDRGAAISALTSKNETPLLCAARGGDLGIFRCLLDKGATMVVGDCHAIHLAAAYNNADILKFLLSLSVDINVPNADGDTAIHLACLFSGDDSVVKLLVSKGANIEARNREGCHPLHLAAQSGNMGAIGVLLRAGAKSTAEDAKARTPLKLAEENGESEVVQLLSNAAEAETSESIE